jgi:assimilatory nitrate reductase catalytic subunit
VYYLAESKINGLIGQVSFKAAHHRDPLLDGTDSACQAVEAVMTLFNLDAKSQDPIMRYADKRRGVLRLVRAQEKVLAALITGPRESLASTKWRREFLEARNSEPNDEAESLLTPFSQPPVQLETPSKTVCNCFNVKESHINFLLSGFNPQTTIDQAMSLLQEKTLCGKQIAGLL